MNAGCVEVQNLIHTYAGGVKALDNVSFNADNGQALAVLGANGAGKSTLLMHLNGCLLPQSGAVAINKTSVTRQTLSSIRRTVGLVFQDPDDQLFMPTVLEDVAFGPLQMGVPKDAALRSAHACLELVGMIHLCDRPPFRLSAGEKRAVSIASALAGSPDILAMDEPTSNLDPLGRRRMIQLLKTFSCTRIIATHDLELAVAVCPYAIILHHGRLAAQGPTIELLNDEPRMLEYGLERPYILKITDPQHHT